MRGHDNVVPFSRSELEKRRRGDNWVKLGDAVADEIREVRLRAIGRLPPLPIDDADDCA